MSTTEMKWEHVERIILSNRSKKSLQKISSSAILKLRGKNGQNILHLCVQQGKLDAIEYLWPGTIDFSHYTDDDTYYFKSDEGVNEYSLIDEKDKKGLSPFDYSLCRDTERKIVKRLVTAGADLSWEKLKHLPWKEKWKHQMITKFCTVLHDIHKNNTVMVAELLHRWGWRIDGIECLQDPELTNCWKLMRAIQLADLAEVKRLLESRVFNKKHLGDAMSRVAMRKRNESPLILHLLLANGAPVDWCSRQTSKITNALTEALLENNLQNASVLLNFEANVEKIFFHDDSHFWLMCWNNFRVHDFSCLDLLMGSQDITKIQFFYADYFPKIFRRIDLRQFLYASRFIKDVVKFEHMGITEGRPDYGGDEKYKNFHKDCDREILRMKQCRIDDHLDFTMWNVLTARIDRLVPLTRNKELIRKIKYKVRSEFTNYRSLIECIINTAAEKNRAIENSIDILSKCVPQRISSNRVVLDRIIYYLGVPNLLIFNSTNDFMIM